MPIRYVHEKSCIEKYGKPFTEVHKWMDEYRGSVGHRKMRHDIEKTPKEAKELFGEGADLACIDHIQLDKIESGKNGKYPVVAFRTTFERLKLIEDFSAFLGESKSSVIERLVIGALNDEAPYLLFSRFQEMIKNRNPFETIEKCERCGQKPIEKVPSTQLMLYHIDGNISNNENINIVVLCKACSEIWLRYKERYHLKEIFYAWFMENYDSLTKRSN